MRVLKGKKKLPSDEKDSFDELYCLIIQEPMGYDP